MKTCDWVGRLIEAESIDGAWEELRIVKVDPDGGAVFAEATANSFGPLPSPARFDLADLNVLWRLKK